MELDCGIAGYGRAPCPLSIVEAVRLHGWTASAPIRLESRMATTHHMMSADLQSQMSHTSFRYREDHADMAMQRFLFDVACLIGAFFAISQNRKNLIRRHEQLHSGSRDDVGEFSCRRCMYNYDGSCG